MNVGKSLSWNWNWIDESFYLSLDLFFDIPNKIEPRVLHPWRETPIQNFKRLISGKHDFQGEKHHESSQKLTIHGLRNYRTDDSSRWIKQKFWTVDWEGDNLERGWMSERLNFGTGLLVERHPSVSNYMKNWQSRDGWETMETSCGIGSMEPGQDRASATKFSAPGRWGI